jgi:hypothetical protein
MIGKPKLAVNAWRTAPNKWRSSINRATLPAKLRQKNP